MLNTSLAGLQSLLNQEIDDSQVEITLQNLLSNYQTTNASFASLQSQLVSLNEQVILLKNLDSTVVDNITNIDNKLNQLKIDTDKSISDLQTTLSDENNAGLQTTLNNLLSNYQSNNNNLANLQIQLNSLSGQITSVKDNAFLRCPLIDS